MNPFRSGGNIGIDEIVLTGRSYINEFGILEVFVVEGPVFGSEFINDGKENCD